MLVYRSKRTLYSVSVTLQLTSIPSFAIYTWTVSHKLTRSAAAMSAYPGVCHNCKKSILMSISGSVRDVSFR